MESIESSPAAEENRWAAIGHTHPTVCVSYLRRLKMVNPANAAILRRYFGIASDNLLSVQKWEQKRVYSFQFLFTSSVCVSCIGTKGAFWIRTVGTQNWL